MISLGTRFVPRRNSNNKVIFERGEARSLLAIFMMRMSLAGLDQRRTRRFG